MIDQQLLGVGWKGQPGKVKRWLDLIQVCQQLPWTFGVIQSAVDAVTQFGAQHLGDIFAQVGLGENAVALGVDALTLFIEHIVILQQVLAHIKVCPFHPCLRGFDHLAHQPAFNGQGFVKFQAAHDHFHLRTAKQAHQVVLKRQVEAGRAGVTLAGGTAAQLVVDAPCFMALGTDNVQSTQFAHACHVFHILVKVLHILSVEGIVFRSDRFQCRKTFFHAHVVRVRHTGVREDAVDLRQGLLGQLAAQFDVHPAACHVGGNGHRTKGTRPGDDQ